MQGPRHGARLAFLECPDVQNRLARRIKRLDFIPLSEGGVAAQMIGGREPRHVHGIARASERRRVGKLKMLKVIDGHSGANRGRENIYSLIHAILPDSLRAEDFALRLGKDNFQVNGA